MLDHHTALVLNQQRHRELIAEAERYRLATPARRRPAEARATRGRRRPTLLPAPAADCASAHTGRGGE